ncbi:hypothetical protein M9H77_29678 [Catharanthus roseus]|uniref:Uncharacterized protein n=1 Tax=Catharanthus roseus TaxID=4058 RepID=A0ACB9ZW11_CATRO|nr:hypothetical protein M9H77_29678 [Catharanthus roseus]
MDKYFEKWKKGSKPVEETSSKKPRVGIEFSDYEIIGDPGLRKPIDSYLYEIRDELRRRSKSQTSHIGFRLLIMLIGYLKILIKILNFDRGIYHIWGQRRKSKNLEYFRAIMGISGAKWDKVLWTYDK